MNPLEEFLEDYGQEKQAFWGDAAKGGMKALGIGLGTAAGMAAVAGAGMAISKMHDAATKNRDFRQMLEYGADLQDAHKQDPRMFNQMYSSLRNVNPAFAKDPLIAGTYMRKMLENPAGAGGTLAEASGSIPSNYGRFGRDLQDATGKAVGSSFGASLGDQFTPKKESPADILKNRMAQQKLMHMDEAARQMGLPFKP